MATIAILESCLCIVLFFRLLICEFSRSRDHKNNFNLWINWDRFSTWPCNCVETDQVIYFQVIFRQQSSLQSGCILTLAEWPKLKGFGVATITFICHHYLSFNCNYCGRFKCTWVYYLPSARRLLTKVAFFLSPPKFRLRFPANPYKLSPNGFLHLTVN